VACRFFDTDGADTSSWHDQQCGDDVPEPVDFHFFDTELRPGMPFLIDLGEVDGSSHGGMVNQVGDDGRIVYNAPCRLTTGLAYQFTILIDPEGTGLCPPSGDEQGWQWTFTADDHGVMFTTEDLTAARGVSPTTACAVLPS
jgi:hypothetical protein